MQDVIKSTKFKTAFCADVIKKYYDVPNDFILFPYNSDYHYFDVNSANTMLNSATMLMKLFMTAIQ